MIAWGTVPQWVSAVVAFVSAITAFYIVFRDRHRHEHEHITRLIISAEQLSRKRTGHTHRITLTNASDRSFYNLRVSVHLDTRADQHRKTPIATERELLRRRRYVAKLRWVIAHGGSDDWYRQIDGQPLPARLLPGAEVVLDVNRWYSQPGYIIVKCQDAAGRSWAIDAQSKIALRYDILVSGIDNWG